MQIKLPTWLSRSKAVELETSPFASQSFLPACLPAFLSFAYEMAKATLPSLRVAVKVRQNNVWSAMENKRQFSLTAASGLDSVPELYVCDCLV